MKARCALFRHGSSRRRLDITIHPVSTYNYAITVGETVEGSTIGFVVVELHVPIVCHEILGGGTTRHDHVSLVGARDGSPC